MAMVAAASVDAADNLARRLRPFSADLGAAKEWCAIGAMASVLQHVRRRHLRQRKRRQGDERERVLAVVSRYLLTGQVSSLTELMRLCAGSGWLNGSGSGHGEARGVLTDRVLRRRLFDLAATVRGRRSRQKAFRGLLQAYCAFPLHEDATPPEAIAGWYELRAWLRERFAAMSRHRTAQPVWFRMLETHRHLLDDHPCAPYAKALLRGNLEDLQRAVDALFIPSDSWLRVEAVMAQITEAASRPDRAFRAMLPALIQLATGQEALRLPARASKRALGMLVRRYAMQEDVESETVAVPGVELFELAIARIGEPNRDRAAWDELVVDTQGNPCSLTREMVSAWMKDTRITRFFAGAVRGGDRAAFWLLFAVLMDEVDVWHEESALRVKSGELGVVVPRELDAPVSVFAWRDLQMRGMQAKVVARIGQHDIEAGKRVMRSLLGIQGDTGA